MMHPIGIADELQKLRQLHFNGALTDDEFTTAKSRLISGPQPNVQLTPFIEQQLAEVRFQNELARIDREWELEREQYQIVGPYGRVYYPSVGLGLSKLLIGVAFGSLLFGLAFTVSNLIALFVPENELLTNVAKFLFSLAMAFTLFFVGNGLYLCVRAYQYARAFQRYQQRHALHSSQDSSTISQPR